MRPKAAGKSGLAGGGAGGSGGLGLTGPFGAIVHFQTPLATGDDMIRITYNGGYQVIPPNLEHACIEQVAFQFQLRQYAGVFRVESGSNTYLEIADRLWVPSVRRVLKQFRRHSYV